MQLSIPATHQRHMRLIERLNIDETVSGRDVSWEWGRIASQFHRPSNYYFPEGAWNTVDRLLEIAMSKEEGKEHSKFRILLRAEVRKIEFETETGGIPCATGVTMLASVKGESGRRSFFIPLGRSGGPVPVPRETRGAYLGEDSSRIEIYTAAVEPTVVLCAGSVESAAILLRSKIPLSSSYNGCHITDHDIFYTSRSFRYKDDGISREAGGIKLQTYVTNLPPSGSEIFLANMAIDTSSSLPRGNQVRDDSLPQYVMAIIRHSPLLSQNSIKLDEKEEPIDHIERDEGDKSPSGGIYDDLQRITEGSMDAIRQMLDIEWIPPPDAAGSTVWQRLPLGGVAHELGSIPMPGADGTGGCVDADLRLRNRAGVRVCDLSVFPVSPEVNPTLTLTTLALRLSRNMNPPTGSLQAVHGIAFVMN